jgi:hypothetical protein
MANRRSTSFSTDLVADSVVHMPQGARLVVDSGTKDNVSTATSEYQRLVLALGKVQLRYFLRL